MKQNDSEYFEELYTAHWAAIYGYFLRRGVSRDNAADLVSEVFTVAWRKLDAIPAGPSARGWLIVTASHLGANSRRSQKSRELLVARLGEQSAIVAPDPAVLHDDISGAQTILLALAKLGEADRELLTLLAWEGLTPKQAAQALGIRQSTVRVRLHRARKRLSAELAHERPASVRPLDSMPTAHPLMNEA